MNRKCQRCACEVKEKDTVTMRCEFISANTGHAFGGTICPSCAKSIMTWLHIAPTDESKFAAQHPLPGENAKN